MKLAGRPLIWKIVSPVSVTFILVLAYLGVVLLRADGDPREFAQIGTQYSIGDSSGSEGYDGQFVYYIANDLDPATVAPHLDVPAYRYQRLLLPILARLLAFGNNNWTLYSIPLINITAHLIAVWLLSRLFQSWSVNRWCALVFGGWVGMLLALRLDLPEPLAFSLVLAAIWFDQKKLFWVSWICFGLALFAKETTIFFVAAQLLVYFSQRNLKSVVGLSIATVVPYVVFQFWLLLQFGQIGLGLGGAGATGLEFVPYLGLWRIAEFSQPYFFALSAVYIPAIFLPALWGLWVSAKTWLSRNYSFIAATLFLNAAIFPILSFAVYREPNGTFRLASGYILAMLLFAGQFRYRKVLNYSFFWLALNVFLLNEFAAG